MIFRSQSRYKRFQCIMPIIMLPARDYRSRWMVMLTHVTRLLWYLSAQSAWIVNVNIDFGVLRTMILKTWTWACTSWKHYWFKISSFSILNVTVGPRSNHATSINPSRSVVFLANVTVTQWQPAGTARLGEKYWLIIFTLL